MAKPQVEKVVAPTHVRLTWQEICARYPDEWVVLTALAWKDADEESDDLASAVVLGHAKSRADSLVATRAAREADQIVEYTSRFTGALVPTGHVSFRFLTP